MLTTKCPGCMRVLQAPLHLGGKHVACPKCGTKILIPSAFDDQPEAAPPIAAATEPAQVTPTAPSPVDEAPTSGTSKRLMLGVGLVVIVAACAAGGWWLTRETTINTTQPAAAMAVAAPAASGAASPPPAVPLAGANRSVAVVSARLSTARVVLADRYMRGYGSTAQPPGYGPGYPAPNNPASVPVAPLTPLARLQRLPAQLTTTQLNAFGGATHQPVILLVAVLAQPVTASDIGLVGFECADGPNQTWRARQPALFGFSSGQVRAGMDPDVGALVFVDTLPDGEVPIISALAWEVPFDCAAGTFVVTGPDGERRIDVAMANPVDPQIRTQLRDKTTTAREQMAKQAGDQAVQQRRQLDEQQRRQVDEQRRQEEEAKRAASNARPPLKQGRVAIRSMMVHQTQGGPLLGSVVDVIFLHRPGEENRSGITFVHSQTGQEMRTSMQEAIRLLDFRNPGMMRNAIECSFGDKYIAYDGGSAGAGFALALIAMVDGLTVDPTLAMTGDITVDGKLRTVGGVDVKLRAAQLAGCKLATIPTGNAEVVSDLLVLGQRQIVAGMQIFGVAHVDDLVTIARSDRPQELTEAMGLFGSIQNDLVRSAALKDQRVVEQLKRVIALAPNHLSASAILAQATGTTPVTLSSSMTMYKLGGAIRGAAQAMQLRAQNTIVRDKDANTEQAFAEMAKLKTIGDPSLRKLINASEEWMRVCYKTVEAERQYQSASAGRRDGLIRSYEQLRKTLEEKRQVLMAEAATVNQNVELQERLQGR